jgi:uncharacterized protein YndB with AHSA1/START domain
MMSAPRLDGQPAIGEAGAMGAREHGTVRVSRRLGAGPERVFDAWLDPAWVGLWMFGPTGVEELVRVELDPRIGGRFSFAVRRDGSTLDHAGRYLTIERPRRLAFTWSVAPEPPDASRVAVELVPLEVGCVLDLTHVLAPERAGDVERVRSSWTRRIESLEEALVAR